MASMMATIKLSAIRADTSAQPRSSILTDKVSEYAERMTEGDVFPPMTVFFDGAVNWLADGFHRYHAAVGIGLEEFQCEVREGGLRDAVLFSCGANAAHGVPRTNEDKRRAVMKLLTDEEWRTMPIREIARTCAVAVGLVHKLQAEAVSVHREQIEKPAERTVTRGGTTYTQNTAAIGKKRAVVESTTLAPAAGEEPSKAKVRRVVFETVRPQSAARTSPARGPEAICERVREAITILSGIDLPHQVVRYFAGRDDAILISERIRPAAAWVAEFSDLWEEKVNAEEHLAVEG